MKLDFINIILLFGVVTGLGIGYRSIPSKFIEFTQTSTPKIYVWIFSILFIVLGLYCLFTLVCKNRLLWKKEEGEK